MNTPSACQTLQTLWKIMIECQINGQRDPSCLHLREKMEHVTLQCWQERKVDDVPPIVIQKCWN